MTPKLLRPALAIIALFIGSLSVLSAAEPPKEEAAVLTKLLSAVEKADLGAFVADGEPAFQRLKKEQFDPVAAQFARRSGSGYTVSFFGDLQQRGYRVTLWKLTFKDGGDDALATLSMKNGKVGGFFIR